MKEIIEQINNKRSTMLLQKHQNIQSIVLRLENVQVIHSQLLESSKQSH